MPIYDHTSFTDVKNKLAEVLPKEQLEHLPFLARISKSQKTVTELLEGGKFIKAYIESRSEGDPICAYERRALPENHGGNFFLLEVKMLQQRKQYFVLSGVQPVSQSRLFIIDKRMTLRQLKIEIFKYFRPLIPGCKVNPKDKVNEISKSQNKSKAEIEE